MTKPPAVPPSSTAAGALVPYMSAKRRHEILDIAFEAVGGVDKLVTEASKDSDGYWEFMKHWAKGLPRMSSNEHHLSETTESLLEELIEAEHTGLIDVTPSKVNE